MSLNVNDLWHIHYVSEKSNGGDLVPFVSSDDTAVIQRIGMVEEATAPFDTDFDYANTYMETPEESSSFTHSANCLLKFKVTLPSSGEIRVHFRKQDDDNYLQMRIASDETITLESIVEGSSTTLDTSVLPDGYWIAMRMDGESLQGFRESSTQIRANVSGADNNFSSEIGGEIASLGSDGAILDLVAYPLEASGSAEEFLNTLAGIVPDGVSMHIIDDTLNDPDAIDVADINGDGNLDVVVANSRNDVGFYWYEQISSTSWAKHAIYEPGPNSEKYEGLAIWDTGDRRFVIGLDQAGNDIRAFKPSSPGDYRGSWTNANIVGSGATISGRYRVQDARVWTINGTKYAVVTHEGNGEGSGGITLLEFTGTDETNPDHWAAHDITIHEGAWGLASQLVTIDGDETIVFSARQGANAGSVPGIYALKFTGTDETNSDDWTEETIDNTDADWIRLDVGDFSGDGNGVDVIAVDLDNSYSIRWWRQSTGWTASTIAPPAGTRTFNVSAVPKTYNDHRQAFIVFVEHDAAYLYRWNGNEYVPTRLDYETNYHPCDEGIVWADVDGVKAFLADSGGGKVAWLQL